MPPVLAARLRRLRARGRQLDEGELGGVAGHQDPEGGARRTGIRSGVGGVHRGRVLVSVRLGVVNSLPAVLVTVPRRVIVRTRPRR